MTNAYRNSPEYNSVPESKETRKTIYLRLLTHLVIDEDSAEIGSMREGKIKSADKHELSGALAANENGEIDFSHDISLKALNELKLLRIVDFADAWSRLDYIRVQNLTDESYNEELASEAFKFSPTKKELKVTDGGD